MNQHFDCEITDDFYIKRAEVVRNLSGIQPGRRDEDFLRDYISLVLLR